MLHLFTHTFPSKATSLSRASRRFYRTEVFFSKSEILRHTTFAVLVVATAAISGQVRATVRIDLQSGLTEDRKARPAQ